MQEYLANGDRNIKVTRTIYKARGKTLDIKMHKKWKYEDTLCSGCKLNPESVEEILKCKYFEKNEEKATYSMFFSEFVKTQTFAGKILYEKLKIRNKMREEVT